MYSLLRSRCKIQITLARVYMGGLVRSALRTFLIQAGILAEPYILLLKVTGSTLVRGSENCFP